MKLAVITCQELPEGVADDAVLFHALRDVGFEADVIAWDTETDWSVYRALLIRSVWDYHLRIEAFERWLFSVAAQTEVINPPAVIRWNSNKNYLSELAAFGITIAPTVWLQRSQTHDLNRCVAELNADQFLLKPTIGADSAGTWRFNKDIKSMQQAQQHLDQWSHQHDMMLQPYLPEVETFGETSLIYFGGAYSHAVRKIPKQGDYRVQDTFAAQDISYQPNMLEFSLAKACLHYLEHRFETIAYARFDFLHAGNVVYLNEAELIEPSLFFKHGHDAAAMFAQAVLQHLEAANTDHNH